VKAELPELYFCDDLVGYGWCFRKNNFLNIGLGRLDRHELHRHVELFVRFLHDRNKVTFSLDAHFPGHAYLLFGHSPRHLTAEGVLLAGDSAGLSYEQSGEGIRPAVESGLLAAEVIRAARGTYSRANLRPYEVRLAERFSRKVSSMESLARRLPPSWRNFAAHRMLKRESFCRNMVVDHWFLHADVPPLEVPVGADEAGLRKMIA